MPSVIGIMAKYRGHLVIIIYDVNICMSLLPILHLSLLPNVIRTGEKITAVQCESPTFTVAWNPRKPLLAFSCDDKYERDRDGGTVKLFGISSES